MAPTALGTAYRDYVLSRKGQDLFAVIVALRQWGDDHLYENGDPRSSLVDSLTGTAVARLEVHSADGRPLAWKDAQVDKVGSGTISGAAG